MSHLPAALFYRHLPLMHFFIHPVHIPIEGSPSSPLCKSTQSKKRQVIQMGSYISLICHGSASICSGQVSPCKCAISPVKSKTEFFWSLSSLRGLSTSTISRIVSVVKTGNADLQKEKPQNTRPKQEGEDARLQDERRNKSDAISVVKYCFFC